MASTNLMEKGVRAIPILSPQDITTTATQTKFVDFNSVTHASFLLHFGNIAAASADQGVVVTLTVATGAASTSEVALAFNYRLSGAAGTDTLGAVTAATSSGVTVATTDDNKLLVIDVDPNAFDAALADGRFASLLITPDAGASATLVSAIALVEEVYGQATPVSAS